MRFERAALALALLFSWPASQLHAFVVPDALTARNSGLWLFAVEEQKSESITSPLPPRKSKNKVRSYKNGYRKSGPESKKGARFRNQNSNDSNNTPGNVKKLSEILQSATLEDFRGEIDTSFIKRPEMEPRDSDQTEKSRSNRAPSSRLFRNGISNPTNNKRPELPPNEPWKAGYMVSKRTQARIQAAAGTRSSTASPTDRAIAVLEALLDTEPERCNETNVMCALTLSAKILGSAPRGRLHDHLLSLVLETLDVLHELVLDERLNPRQLCNAVWAIAKHYNRDHTLLPPPPTTTAMSTDTIMGSAETWVLQNETEQSAERRVSETIDAIARQLTWILSSKDTQSPKVGEIAMACWAYGVLRPRKLPPGWAVPPRIGKVPHAAASQSPGVEYITFEQWNSDNHEADEDIDSRVDVAAEFLDAVGDALCQDLNDSDDEEEEEFESGALEGSRNLLQECSWQELTNVAWAYATHGHCRSPSAELAMASIAKEARNRLNTGSDSSERMLSRDVSQIVWALGTLQCDNFRLGNDLVSMIDAVATRYLGPADAITLNGFGHRPLKHWTCPDLVQLALSMAHGRVDHLPLLNALYEEAHTRVYVPSGDNTGNYKQRQFRNFELSVLLWAQARMNLRSAQGEIFDDFVDSAVSVLSNPLKGGDESVSLHQMGIGIKEASNIAWSLTVLEHYHTANAKKLFRTIFREVAEESEQHRALQLEHAHQLWQSFFLLESEQPDIVQDVPRWFREFLEEKWNLEKSRRKKSSARHRSLSQTLNLMGVAHYNEHDEDIDVAIVLKDDSSWTNAARISSHLDAKLKVAVEFDGPMHFTRQETESSEGRGSSAPIRPRALGHTVLKYRLLKKQGWTVVRVPYFEFDKIPFWASMERQRYLQRLLKTHANIRFSEVDVSEYKAMVPNRASRFD